MRIGPGSIALLCAALLGCSKTDGASSAKDGGAASGGWPDASAATGGNGGSGGSGATGGTGGTTGANGDAANDAPVADPCTSVAQIGDSLTAYTVPELTAEYASAGMSVKIDAYGGRAILEKLPADPTTGRQAAKAIAASGFAGCWVIALGTNDTANVAAGANHTRGKAIDEMMAAIDPAKQARVMWVNTFTTKTSGYWQNANMVLWNEALIEAKTRWPNMVVFDWAATAATGAAAFSDGIHHTSAGTAIRNAAIVGALKNAFPGG